VQLFDMIDADGSGFIDSHEFIRPLSRWVHDSKTAPSHLVEDLCSEPQGSRDLSELIFGFHPAGGPLVHTKDSLSII